VLGPRDKGEDNDHCIEAGRVVKKYNCENCGSSFSARAADQDRGWARFCSKSRKATKQSRTATKPRHNGRSSMKNKRCADCGEPAINGVYIADGVVWGCDQHHREHRIHPFSSEALGQD
jgi:ribosomal protein S27AE